MVTIALKYQLLTSSPGVAGSAARVLESRPPIALLLHILMHKKYFWVRPSSLLFTALGHNLHLTSKGFDLVFPSSCWHSSHFICNNVSSATLQTSSLAPSLSPLLGFWSCFTFLPCAVCVNMSWGTGCTITLSCPPRATPPSLAYSLPQSSSTCVPSETNSLL